MTSRATRRTLVISGVVAAVAMLLYLEGGHLIERLFHYQLRNAGIEVDSLRIDDRLALPFRLRDLDITAGQFRVTADRIDADFANESVTIGTLTVTPADRPDTGPGQPIGDALERLAATLAGIPAHHGTVDTFRYCDQQGCEHIPVSWTLAGGMLKLVAQYDAGDSAGPVDVTLSVTEPRIDLTLTHSAAQVALALIVDGENWLADATARLDTRSLGGFELTPSTLALLATASVPLTTTTDRLPAAFTPRLELREPVSIRYDDFEITAPPFAIDVVASESAIAADLVAGSTLAVHHPKLARGTVTLVPTSECTATMSIIEVDCTLTLDADVAGDGWHAVAGALRTTILVSTADWRGAYEGNVDIVLQDAHTLHGIASGTIDPARVDVTLRAATIDGIALQTLSASQAFDTLDGSLRSSMSPQVSRLLSLAGIDEPDVAEGRLSIATTAAWNASSGITSLVNTVSADGVRISIDGYDLVDVSLRAVFGGWPVQQTQAPAVVHAGLVDIGVAVTDVSLSGSITVDLAGSAWRLDGGMLRGKVLGGTLQSSAVALKQDQGALSGVAPVEITGMELDQLLSLDRDDFTSHGRLNGSVPIQVRDGTLTVKDARVSAVAPGGYIRYTPASGVTASLAGNEHLAFVMDTLSDFQYHSLNAIVNYSPDGDMVAKTSIQGHNPLVEGGRDIHLNVTIEENVGTLLKSLRISEVFTDSIESRTKRQ